jgi:HK97 family phage prohead protease
MSKELRFGNKYAGSIETRAGEGGAGIQVISGYAAQFNIEADLGWFIETIAPGAFDNVMKDDVIACFNHDDDQILARTSSGTLQLSTDKQGLFYAFDVPNLTYAQDLAENIRLKNITQSSFCFEVESEEWVYDYKDGKDLRKITKIKRLYDVSPVVWPAYADLEELSSEMRSMMNLPQKRVAQSIELNKNKRSRLLALLGGNK